MFHKDDVNYETTQEVYKYLRINSELYFEFWGTTGRIPWNYGKFLVNSEGKVVLWRAMTNPDDIEADIVALLNA
jgi:glutathione peroxidase-family protein